MKPNNITITKLLFIVIVSVCFFANCKKDPSITKSSFPKEVENILINKCATAGCHNDKSFENAAGLNLTTWDKLVQGGNSGASVIAYSAAYSSLFQFINTDSSLGPVAKPTMPYNGSSLTKDEILTIKNWINNGAKNDEGKVPFEDNANTRQKIYISNQGCDVVSVVDAKTKLVMRMVEVGKGSAIEVPHCIRVSADKKHWFVCFTDGEYFQKYNATTDKFVAEVNIGVGKWNIFKLSEDSKIAYVSDLSNDAKIVKVNTETMTVLETYQGVNLFTFPHGIAFTKNYDTIYITAQFGNMVYRLIPGLMQVENISLQKGQAPSASNAALNPHEIIFSPDYSKYFISCQTTNEIRVMDAKTDTLLQVIAVGAKPEEFTISKKKNELYVSCSEDVNLTFPNSKGSIYVINMSTLQVVKKIEQQFYQPHGLAINDDLGLLYVASRNVLSTGPAPHHTSVCGGRNGFMSVININNWQLQKPVTEVSVDPYSMDAR
jgi:YVTN family beta-propeller protein